MLSVSKTVLCNDKIQYSVFCLTTDTKPTYNENANGSILLELNASTGVLKMYIFNGVTKLWVEVN